MRAVSPSRQSPAATPTPLEPEQDQTQSDNAERNAAIAGAIGAAIDGIAAAQESSDPVYIAQEALIGGARYAAVAGTFSRSKGSIVTRGLKAAGAWVAVPIAVGLTTGVAAGLNKITQNFGVGQVTRPYV